VGVVGGEGLLGGGEASAAAVDVRVGGLGGVSLLMLM